MKTDFFEAVSCSTKLRGKTEMEPEYSQCMNQCNKDLKNGLKSFDRFGNNVATIPNQYPVPRLNPPLRISRSKSGQ